jgi:hypothetical protein
MECSNNYLTSITSPRCYKLGSRYTIIVTYTQKLVRNIFYSLIPETESLYYYNCVAIEGNSVTTNLDSVIFKCHFLIFVLFLMS